MTDTNSKKPVGFEMEAVYKNELLAQLVEKGRLTGRSYDKTIRVARTIADLEESEHINDEHLSEALLYRNTLKIS